MWSIDNFYNCCMIIYDTYYLKDAVKYGSVGFNAAYGARSPKIQQKEIEILTAEEVLQFL